MSATVRPAASPSRTRRLRRRSAALAVLLGAATAVGAPAFPASATTPLGVQERISSMGADGDGTTTDEPAVAYDPRADQHLVVWEGATVAGGELEIFGLLVAASGGPAGPQFRISDMGPDGDDDYNAQEPAAVYNPRADEYLVIWKGDDDTAPLVDNEDEIFAQRLSAAGAEVGPNDARISSVGPDGDPAPGADDPALDYNVASNEYLVAWQGDDAVDQDEIYVQRLDATGAQVGADDQRISDMGPDGSLAFEAQDPFVAYSERANEYLVAWQGEDDTAPQVDNEREVFIQRLGATGAELGVNDVRISDAGPAGDPDFDAIDPVVVHNPQADEYLVAWQADDVFEEDEIYVQRVSATGAQLGTDDQRVSDMGPDGDTDFDARDPGLAYDMRANEYLVAWQGEDGPPLAIGEGEVSAQRLGASGAEIGANDLRVSTIGADGDSLRDAGDPAVAYGSQRNEYLVAYDGDDPPLDDEEAEVFAHRFGAAAPVQVAATCKSLPAPAPPSPPDPGSITLTTGQLLINQRIDQAAIRRANGVQGWLDDGVEGRDVCQGSVGRAELRSDVVTGFTGVPTTLGPPSPRPVAVAPPGPPDPGSITLTTGQLLINQRISQAAIRRLNGLKARLDTGLTGGDVVDGAVGRAQLVAGTQILVAPPPVGPPRASTTRIAPAQPGDPSGVTLTTTQLLINQRISQAAVRRANDLIRRIGDGLAASDIADASLTGADLAAGLPLATR